MNVLDKKKAKGNYSRIMEYFRECGVSENAIQMYTEYLEQKLNTVNYDAVDYCLNKFIESELDFVTVGDRGLGRLSLFYPRLAGYMRKSISMLTGEQLSELSQLIYDLMLDSYLATLVWLETTISKRILPDQLFRKWIPSIYVQDLNQFIEQRDFVMNHITISAEKTEQFLNNYHIHSGLFKKDMITEILLMYIVGGSILRDSEINLIENTLI